MVEVDACLNIFNVKKNEDMIERGWIHIKIHLLKFYLSHFSCASEAFNWKGYSPVLNFEVDDFDQAVTKFMSYGAEKDGEIIDNEFHKVIFLNL